MTGKERRVRIVELLEGAQAPVSGTALARELGVSRQVIVQDVALLRADGTAVVSTSRGYSLARDARPCRLLKEHHRDDEVADEMYLIVDMGGTIEDTMVNHRTYGQMSAYLGVSSRRDVERFLDDLRSSRSSLLSGITSGYHFHHVRADSEETLDAIEQALREHGWLVPMSDYEREALR